MVCQNDGSCACATGFLNCDGDASNGCEIEGESCERPCAAESDAAICRRLGKICGDVTDTDQCGVERTAACGSCVAGQECGDDNLCHTLCTQEEDEAFCARLGKTCGSVTAMDNCDRERMASCGSCQDGQMCGDDNTCHDGCDSESDAAFCARLGKTCGDVTGTDNCGNARTAACGTCPDGQTCGDDNTCSCRTEGDDAFCARVGKNCGEVTRADNCGDPRTVDCGTCDDGLLCASNLCCQPEDDATFCSRQRKDCGSFAGVDNCGQRRVVDCGTCSGTASCGSQVANVCGPCVGETDAQLCVQAGATCGQVRVPDRCGETRVVPDCGTCSGGGACLPGNQCGTPDGVWLNGRCWRSGAGREDCATDLFCVRTWARSPTIYEGVCKQLCDSNADCTTGGSCAIEFAPAGWQGICGELRSPGDACSTWTTSSDLCFDRNLPPDTYLDCASGTCSYMCDYEGNLDEPLYECPAGQSCAGSWSYYERQDMNVQLCQ
ncbi:hypothetical protein AKJ08_1261 [Vulgatibacter incomptus]|uniref:Uncharacterized protein n=2 Tax=Vulgatibacter incomptus TaxID=1391653 RepID=A0A0K1PCN0_9BACT|nr:hypothetical protein AKJ08_1261 [Vulgatibacter incomptus]